MGKKVRPFYHIPALLPHFSIRHTMARRMANWEETLTAWAKGPGTTEQEKSENAERAVKKAVAASERLSAMDVSVFLQGSYRARTNTKQDSDVDICVRLNSTFFDEYPAGKTRSDFGNILGTISFAEYKGLVHAALDSYLGQRNITPGDKAFDVHENTYRIDADVIPAFEHRRYTGQFNGDGSHYYLSGVAFDCESGKRIINWPEQNYLNGQEKHEATGRRYKKMVRILKRLRNVMQEEKIVAANNIASFLIECLVWNVPNEQFSHETYRQDIRAVLAHTFNNTLSDDKCNKWVEENELKYLFHPTQPWTREQAHNFLSAAWDRLGLE
jgi:predicted nucleotidyltransferase